MLRKTLAILLAVLTFLTVLPIYSSADVGDHEFDETEPNDTEAQAKRLEHDSTVYGELSYDDLDHFKISLTQESTIRVLCLADYSVLLLAIFQGDDCLVVGQEGYTDNGSPRDYINVTLPAGVYYLVLLNSETDWYNNEYIFYYECIPTGNSGGGDVHSHEYYEEVIAPTCTEQGYTIFTCDCGDYYVDNYVDPAHTYDDDYDLECNLCGFAREFIDGWKILNGERVYYENGAMVTNRWIKDANGWSYLGSNGYCVKNKWMKDSTGWCYLENNGYMATNKWIKDSTGWCYVGANGYMVYSKWVKDSTGWCYVGANGYMTYNKWVKDSKGWCYVGANGYMAYNKWIKDSKGWCYVGANGYMTYNKWIKDSTGWCYVGANGYMTYNKWIKDSKGWCYVGANGYMAYNKWIKDSTGWCYVGADGYMVTDYWVKDSSGWCYIGANGYVTSHELDYHNHSFSAPTYTKPATCSCGAVNGEPLDLPIYLAESTPIYTDWYDNSRVKLDNFYYYMSTDTIIKIHFDAEKIYDCNGTYAGNYVAAKFKLFDENGYLIDDATWIKDDMYVGEKVFGEYVYLYLDNWSGKGDLTLVIEDY